MAEAPEVKPHDEIMIGQWRAVVATVHGPGHVEVVWLDDKKQAINEDAIWEEDGWRFKVSGPTGGYADKYDRLTPFVQQLRRSRRG